LHELNITLTRGPCVGVRPDARWGRGILAQLACGKIDLKRLAKASDPDNRILRVYLPGGT
jgi:hypothetical protein